MIKSELTEIKKQLTPKHCSITRICGCYVDGEKNIKAEFKKPFLGLPEEEMFKYFEILRKPLGGTLDKNLLTLEFPLDAEAPGGTQDFLNRLRESKLKDDDLLSSFYSKVIENYEYVGNYLILLIHDVYDVPGKTMDGIEMDDASDEIYEYIMCAICPVNLSDAGLSYIAEDNSFHNRIRDWVVELPANAFLFPAFNDRTTDIHSLMYYSKDPEERSEFFAEKLFGTMLPMTAGTMKDTFNSIVEETLGEECNFESVKAIHEKLTELVEEHKEEEAPLSLDRDEVKTIFAGSGVSNNKMEEFDKHFEENAGRDSLKVSNIMNKRSFDVKMPDVVIKVKPDRTDLISAQIIDGRQCLVIELNGDVEVNGITVRKDIEGENEAEEN